MPEPEPEVRTLVVSAKSRKTEMGFEVVVHSPAVNITVELDLDWDPEFFYGLLQNLPVVIENEMAKYLDDDLEEEADEHQQHPPQ